MAKIGRGLLLWLILPPLYLAMIPNHAGGASRMLTEGQALAEKNCAVCHAIGRTGDSPHRGAPPFRVIAARGHVDDLQEALAEGIVVGHADMPEFELAPAQIGAFLTYLKSLAPRGH